MSLDSQKINIRNDDIAYDTDPEQFEHFCKYLDTFGFKQIIGITIMGSVQNIQRDWNNERIKKESGDKLFIRNERLLKVLQERVNKGDKIALHGLRHVHCPEVEFAKLRKDLKFGFNMLEKLFDKDLKYFIAPFNETNKTINKFCYGEGYPVLANDWQSLEMLMNREPDEFEKMKSNKLYLHSWRYGSWHKYGDLQKTLTRLAEKGYET